MAAAEGPTAFRSGGSGATSTQAPSTEQEEEYLQGPNAVDCKRLTKLRAEQEKQLQTVRARVERFTNQEQRVWKDVAAVQQKSLQLQEVQLQKQAQKADIMRVQREHLFHEQVLREQARGQRQRQLETREAPRQSVVEENRTKARQVREETRQQQARLLQAKEHLLRRKEQLVDARREAIRQRELRKQLDGTRKEQVRQDLHHSKYAGLQEDLQSIEHAIAAAEMEEETAVSRLQNSQSVHAELIHHYQAGFRSPRGSTTSLHEGGGMVASTPPPREPGGRLEEIVEERLH